MSAQQIVWGVDYLKSILRELQARKVLLVSGFTLNQLDINFDTLNIEVVKFSDFTPNPLYEQVEQGVKLFHQEACDIIIAIGGGSAIDVAKCIKLFYKSNLAQDINIPLIAIPTTAGTGSESTRHAVIYQNDKKQSISDPYIIPNYAILEPHFLDSLPLYQKKCTMLDALCQGIESWWSINMTPTSRSFSQKTIRGIMENWRQYLSGDKQAARAMLGAANFSGQAINITATTAPHAMSYKITSLYNLPHGHAVAICLPEVWLYMQQYGNKKVQATLSEINQYITLKDFQGLLRDLELTYPQSKNRTSDLKQLAESVNPVRLKNNPVVLEYQVLYNMYERIIK